MHGTRVTLRFGAAAFVFCLAGAARAVDFYVAPNGAPTNSGTLASPWDLQTALNMHMPIAPGDTIWLRGGQYFGPFTSYLKGTPTQLIIVRNYNKERVLLDYSLYECDPGVCPQNDPTCDPAHPHNHICNSFASECQCDPSVNPACTAPFNNRGNALTVPQCSHDLWIWGLEFAYQAADSRINLPPGNCSGASDPVACCYPNGDLLPECDQFYGRRNKYNGIEIRGANIKLINSISRDGYVGLPLWITGLNDEFYGTLVFNNGMVNPLRGNGHGTYDQNFDCNDFPSERRFGDLVFFNNFGWGINSYGDCGTSQSLSVDGVVSLNNGAPAKRFYQTDPVFLDNVASYYPAIEINSNRPLFRIQLHSFYTYHTLGKAPSPWQGVAIVAGSGNSNTDLSIENSMLVGDGRPVILRNWNMLKLTGNTVVGGVNYPTADGARFPNHEIDNNRYFVPGGPVQMSIPDLALDQDHIYSFADWQSAFGFDAHSTASTALPTSNNVFLRPNAYEAGRAHLIIYNWLNLPSVAVDLSTAGLAEGQAYKIHNLQSFKTDLAAADYFGNVVASGTYQSANPIVNVPMTDTAVTPPLGFPYAIDSTLPQFGVFLILGQ